MKEIVVISGKGGTGKTSITASFAHLAGSDVIVADCDVDAADMHILMKPDFGEPKEFFSGELALIDQENCIKCGKCETACRFNAIKFDGEYKVDSFSCEGCGYCARVCPVDAISNHPQNVGNWYRSNIRSGTQMVHAALKIGAENSGKLVAKVKNEAKKTAAEQKKELVIVDGSPGVGCPVVSSLSGASFCLLVTEPSVSGFHDLKRVYELVKKFGIQAGAIINKSDLDSNQNMLIKAFLKAQNIELLGEIPYNENFTKAMIKGRTIVEFDKEINILLSDSWKKIKYIVANQ